MRPSLKGPSTAAPAANAGVNRVGIGNERSGQVIDSEKTAAPAEQTGDAACGVVDSVFVTPRDSNSASGRLPVLTTHGKNSNTSNSTGHLNSTDNNNNTDNCTV